MEGFLNNGAVQLLGVIITAISAYGIAKFNRSGAKEANQTTGWTNLVAALQREVEGLRKEQDEEKDQIKKLDVRVKALERSRHRWKFWGRRVVEVMESSGIRFPDPPEPLEDTDPNMQGV